MSITTASPDTPVALLKKYFGYDTFRPGQEEIVGSILAKRDTVVIMPTGGGKSVCFQIPALACEGTAIVVSPLIALMKDQVDSLRANGILAAYLNSSQDSATQANVWSVLRSGQLKLLYISPEKLLSEAVFSQLSQLPISLIAIDEAHCISSWGHDFRPEYTQLGQIKTRLPRIPIIALTATADRLTRKDIAIHLGLQDPAEFVASFDRPNLKLTVIPANSRSKQIIKYLHRHSGESGIIYCLSRKSCESLAAQLLNEGFSAAYYHAGMDSGARSRVQEAFIKDNIQIICATIAFGMGIDKSNVRFVLHYNIPKNIEGYYQEIGRAGRDGLPGEAVLFYTYADINSIRMLVQQEKGMTQERIDLFEAKLERMQHYADAQQCRRRILLSYFGEEREEDCGNCDVCQTPRQRFDGTELAQKALSAVIRCQEKANRSQVVEILRGNRTSEVVRMGFDKVKTFGVGKDVAPSFWKDYVVQLINHGLLEIAYDRHHALTITPMGRQVLFEGRKVMLVKPEYLLQDRNAPSTAATVDNGPASLRLDAQRQELLALLKMKRKAIADDRGSAPYMVFSDASLHDMALYTPIYMGEFEEVSGVGEYKAEEYGREFTLLIAAFLDGERDKGRPVASFMRPKPQGRTRQERDRSGPALPKVDTKLATYALLQEGQSPEEVAGIRGLTVQTIMGHMAELFLQGKAIDLGPYLTLADYKIIKPAVEAEGGTAIGAIKSVFDRLREQFTYEQIRLTKTYMMAGKVPPA